MKTPSPNLPAGTSKNGTKCPLRGKVSLGESFPGGEMEGLTIHASIEVPYG